MSFYRGLREPRLFSAEGIVRLFAAVDRRRVDSLARALSGYIRTNFPAAVSRKRTLADYRTNPYVLMTSASAVDLSRPGDLAAFLVHNKLYMGLETSFGKSVESVCVGFYPIGVPKGVRWEEPPEKVEEFATLQGLRRDQRARLRAASVWREVDKSCVLGATRYLLSVKSGPATINDTQVEAMKAAISTHYRAWMAETRKRYKGVTALDVVIGLTYGTNKTTNNKENQVLVKLLEHGFEPEDSVKRPGVLIDGATRAVRLYRRVGIDFWALVGRPDAPARAQHTFLEILLALSKALTDHGLKKDFEGAVNRKIDELVAALGRMKFPKGALPDWVKADFSEVELGWLLGAISAYYDEGI